jgi:hypothetical protein
MMLPSQPVTTPYTQRYVHLVQGRVRIGTMMISWLPGMVMTVAPLGRPMLDAAPRIGAMWLGLTLGTLLVSMLTPLHDPRRLITGGALLLMLALLSWNLVIAGVPLLLASISVGVGIALLATGFHQLADRVAYRPATWFTWMGGSIGWLLGMGCRVALSWHLVVNLMLIPPFVLFCLAVHLVAPPRTAISPAGWRETWLGVAISRAEVLALLPLALQNLMLTGLALVATHLVTHQTDALLALAIGASSGTLWLGTWGSALLHAWWAPPPWWESILYLCAGGIWLGGVTSPGAITPLGLSGMFLLLGLARAPEPLSQRHGILLLLVSYILVASLPWLFSSLLSPIHVLPLFALPLVLFACYFPITAWLCRHPRTINRPSRSP